MDYLTLTRVINARVATLNDGRKEFGNLYISERSQSSFKFLVKLYVQEEERGLVMIGNYEGFLFSWTRHRDWEVVVKLWL